MIAVVFVGGRRARRVLGLGRPGAGREPRQPRAQLEYYAENEFTDYYSENPAAVFAGTVWTNNAWIAAQCVLFGITGVWPLMVLVQNAVGVGTAAAVMLAFDRGDVFLLFILPHGLLELTCIFVAGAAGLHIFWAWVAPGRRSRGESLAAAGRSLATIAIGLDHRARASRGSIEGFVTAQPWPWPVKIGIGAARARRCSSFYMVVVGGRAYRRGETGDLTEYEAGTADARRRLTRHRERDEKGPAAEATEPAFVRCDSGLLRAVEQRAVGEAGDQGADDREHDEHPQLGEREPGRRRSPWRSSGPGSPTCCRSGSIARWMSVSVRPIARPANAALPRVECVTPRITMTNSAVKSTSTMIAAPRPKPPGESSSQPLLAKPPSWALLSQPSGPNRPISTMSVVATAPPTIWAMM